MKIVKLNDCVGVAAQISVEDVADIAAAGYKVLVNNRPDGEEGNQPEGVEIAAAAEAADLEYHHMPVTAMNFPGRDFTAMTGLLEGNMVRVAEQTPKWAPQEMTWLALSMT